MLFIVACFLGEFSYYWWHRPQHEWPALWELHKLHHSDESLNSTSIFRSHFFELAGQAAVHGLLPFFSTPQDQWIHHSRLPLHQDKNYAIWLPVFDKIFGSYYGPLVDEYPPTGLSSGEQAGSVLAEQWASFAAWARMLRGARGNVSPDCACGRPPRTSTQAASLRKLHPNPMQRDRNPCQFMCHPQALAVHSPTTPTVAVAILLSAAGRARALWAH